MASFTSYVDVKKVYEYENANILVKKIELDTAEKSSVFNSEQHYLNLSYNTGVTHMSGSF